MKSRVLPGPSIRPVPSFPPGQSLALVALAGTPGAGPMTRYVPPQRIAIAGFALTIVLFGVLLLLLSAWQFRIAIPLFIAMGIVPGVTFAIVST